MAPIDALASVSYDRSLAGPGWVRSCCTSNPRLLSPSARPWAGNAQQGYLHILGAAINGTPVRSPLRLAG